MSIEKNLDRIATALETIAAGKRPVTVTEADGAQEEKDRTAADKKAKEDAATADKKADGAPKPKVEGKELTEGDEKRLLKVNATKELKVFLSKKGIGVVRIIFEEFGVTRLSDFYQDGGKSEKPKKEKADELLSMLKRFDIERVKVEA